MSASTTLNINITNEPIEPEPTESYSITFSTNNSSYGAVSKTLITVDSGTTYTISGSTISFSDGQVVAAAAVPPTAQYNYSFDGWLGGATSSASGVVSSDMDFVANFTRTTRSYTITFSVNDPSYGSIDKTSATLEYGTTFSVASDGSLVFQKGTTEVLRVSPTPNPSEGSDIYEFSNWSLASGTITGDASFVATFSHSERAPETYRLTFQIEPESYGSLSLDSHSVTTLDVKEGSTIDIISNALYINKSTAEEKVIYATKKPSDDYYDYIFDGWTFDPKIISGASGIINSDVTVTASFSTGELKEYTIKIEYIDDGDLEETSITVPAGSELIVSGNEITIKTPDGTVAEQVITAKEYKDTDCPHDFTVWSESSQIIEGDLEIHPAYTCKIVPTPTPTPEPTPEQPYVPDTGLFTNVSSVTIASGIGLIISLIVLCGALFMTKSRLRSLKSRISSLLDPERFSFYQPLRYVALISCFALLVLSAIFIFPKVDREEFSLALTGTELSLSTSGTLSGDIILGGEETSSHSAILTDTVKISDSTTNGYQLYLSVSSESDNTAKSADSDSPDAFFAVAGNNSALGTGEWGYTVASSPSISDSVWSPVPTKNSETILVDASGSATLANVTHDINYGFVAGEEFPSGTYSATVVYTAIAEPESEEPEPEFTVTPGPSKTIAATEIHTLVIDENGELWVWGGDQGGSLGVGQNPSYHTNIVTLGTRSIPISTRPINLSRTIFAEKKFQKVAASTTTFEHSTRQSWESYSTAGMSFAIDEDGNLWVWGGTNIRDDDSEDFDVLLSRTALGFNAGSADYIASPVNLSERSGHPFNGKKFIDISSYPSDASYSRSSNELTLAIDSDGHLWMWGRKVSGFVSGFYEYSAIMEPIDLSTSSEYGLYGKKFEWVKNDGWNVFARDTNGDLWGYGDNSNYNPYSKVGLLGDGTVSTTEAEIADDFSKFVNLTAIPESPIYRKKIVEISQSAFSQESAATFAIDEEGHLWAWGSKWLGDNNGDLVNENPFPKDITTIPESPIYGKKFIKVDGQHRLAIDNTGELWHWPTDNVCNYRYPSFGCLDSWSDPKNYWPAKSKSGSSIENVKFNNLTLSHLDGGSFLVDIEGHLWVYGIFNDQGCFGNGEYWIYGDGSTSSDYKSVADPQDLNFLYPSFILAH